MAKKNLRVISFFKIIFRNIYIHTYIYTNKKTKIKAKQNKNKKKEKGKIKMKKLHSQGSQLTATNNFGHA